MRAHAQVEALVRLGADLDARDVTACTPLQNAAHGTYSALAAMPAGARGVPSLPAGGCFIALFRTVSLACWALLEACLTMSPCMRLCGRRSPITTFGVGRSQK